MSSNSTRKHNNDAKADSIEHIYHSMTDALIHSQATSVPRCKDNFFKFWWDDELKKTKQRSIASCQLWKSMGRPRSGAIYDNYKKDKAAYKIRIRAKKREDEQVYTNELHEALLRNQGTTFWKC